MRIVGTAGHVDHGKSSLVRALTGTDPDRWLEERVRGMSLDLGFAHLRYDDGIEGGIIDVPGHERFLHNMLAGAAGMDVLLLVVAADEGPRPQTLEHLAILEYLNVRRTIVVLTKADLVDESGLAIAREVTRDALAGTFAEGAPSFAVSTLTGEGIEALRAGLHAELRALGPREPNAPPYLPIDRVFALPGHGTIVTGTLMQGRIASGDELVLAPSGRAVRVRSLHVFGERRSEAGGGSRVALNLPSLEVADAARGDVVASSQFAVASSFEVVFRPRPDALALLRRRTPVRAYLGSAEILGTLVFDRAPESSAAAVATLRLRAPSLLVPGSAFVVRRPSPKTLLGGGTIGAPAAGAELEGEADAPEIPSLLAALRAIGLEGGDAARIGGAANVLAARAETVLADLADSGRVLRVRRPDAYVHGELASDVFSRALAAIEASERERPWLAGCTSLGLARTLALAEPMLVRVLGAFVDDGALAYRSGYYATPGFEPRLLPEQRALFAQLFGTSEAATPPALTDLRPAFAASRVPGAAAAFETLLVAGEFVRVGDHVYRSTRLAHVRRQLESYLREHREITVSTFRELAGISRKYAVPLMEWFVGTGVTVRSGDVRRLRREPPPGGRSLGA